jgi:hypothetical protein
VWTMTNSEEHGGLLVALAYAHGGGLTGRIRSAEFGTYGLRLLMKDGGPRRHIHPSRTPHGGGLGTCR